MNPYIRRQPARFCRLFVVPIFSHRLRLAQNLQTIFFSPALHRHFNLKVTKCLFPDASVSQLGSIFSTQDFICKHFMSQSNSFKPYNSRTSPIIFSSAKQPGNIGCGGIVSARLLKIAWCVTFRNALTNVENETKHRGLSYQLLVSF